MTQILPLSLAKIQLSRLVKEIVRREDEVVITRHGKPAAVLLNAEEYAAWKETQEIKASPTLMREIREGLRALQRGRGKRYRSVEALFEPKAA